MKIVTARFLVCLKFNSANIEHKPPFQSVEEHEDETQFDVCIFAPFASHFRYRYRVPADIVP